MAKLIKLNIDVTKIQKERLYQGKKGTYLNLMVALNDEEDEYGNIARAWHEQSKEERESNIPKAYLGNGKEIWSSEGKKSEESNIPDDLPF